MTLFHVQQFTNVLEYKFIIMKGFYIPIYLSFLLTFVKCTHGLEPDSVAGSLTARIISLGIVVAVYEARTMYTYLNFEQCAEPWVHFNLNGLTSDMHNKVFGQHIAKKMVIDAMKDHMMKEMPTKALVMSFHGCTGCGKNFINSIIAKNLFSNGVASNHFHLYLERDFNQLDKIDQYKAKLKNEIKEATESCEHNLFVFDEVDKMVPGVLDALYPFVKRDSKKEYRKNVFIFLSNAGATDIDTVTLDLLTQGKHRHSITYNDVGPLISIRGYNEVGGLQKSAIVRESLIDEYLPFLPLERVHVRECVKAELRKLNIDYLKLDREGLPDQIVDQMVFSPKGKEKFSVSGCKKVSIKVDLFVKQ